MQVFWHRHRHAELSIFNIILNCNCNWRNCSYCELYRPLPPERRLAHIYPAHRQLQHLNDAQYLHWERLCANERSHLPSTYKTVPRCCYESYISCLGRGVLEMNQPCLIHTAVKITAKLAVRNRFWQTLFLASELQSPRGSAATPRWENCLFLAHH